MDFSKNYK
jgi:hypothetical protein